ncbi:hypothetical protein M406DRAFT_58346 [Cryphonectria parasitica EP155]|uniref:Uncharacterized protein n=1 Tax=Cryphonectria parasitica (strain ATCC 38755 / EP155) TaxID=660469 RepID=A0A9P4Y833_CRYP1|nr:uncharacterized protein M406DRAFT_58346 [Cryphonectria parasitica EP155]KAF3768190.1 hypothetical protein M406DRAFT_58346 [Cryphonectria parasitica EP155]
MKTAAAETQCIGMQGMKMQSVEERRNLKELLPTPMPAHLEDRQPVQEQQSSCQCSKRPGLVRLLMFHCTED